jgi:hypothetical protein
MGIELLPKFLSLTQTRRYQPSVRQFVAKCCQFPISFSRRTAWLVRISGQVRTGPRLGTDHGAYALQHITSSWAASSASSRLRMIDSGLNLLL